MHAHKGKHTGDCTSATKPQLTVDFTAHIHGGTSVLVEQSLSVDWWTWNRLETTVHSGGGVMIWACFTAAQLRAVHKQKPAKLNELKCWMETGP